jgi:uncharacterized protein (DUF4415 family)
MKRAKTVKSRKAKSQKPRKAISLNAVAEAPKGRSFSIPERMEWYRPIKNAVTLRVDADVLAWFKKSGHGYQTRINRALRDLMDAEMRDEKKASGE